MFKTKLGDTNEDDEETNRGCFHRMYKKEIELDEYDLLFSAIEKTTETKLMCIERAVVEDLCELYSKTAMRLKWIALERHKELIAFKKIKDKAQTLVPI